MTLAVGGTLNTNVTTTIFFGAVFLDDSDLSDSEQPLENGSWSISAFLLAESFSDHFVSTF